jgi:protein-tyrosine phosphatase
MPASDGPRPTSVLFVCLGNICRSPLAEGVFRSLVSARELDDRFTIDSAGTGGWHVGQAPDPRSTDVAAAHGIDLTGSARRIEQADLDRFDVILAMDRENLRHLERMAATGAHARIHLLRDFDSEGEGDEVPDPYYGGPDGFETVYQMVHRSCTALLEELRPD